MDNSSLDIYTHTNTHLAGLLAGWLQISPWGIYFGCTVSLNVFSFSDGTGAALLRNCKGIVGFLFFSVRQKKAKEPLTSFTERILDAYSRRKDSLVKHWHTCVAYLCYVACFQCVQTFRLNIRHCGNSRGRRAAPPAGLSTKWGL